MTRTPRLPSLAVILLLSLAACAADPSSPHDDLAVDALTDTPAVDPEPADLLPAEATGDEDAVDVDADAPDQDDATTDAEVADAPAKPASWHEIGLPFPKDFVFKTLWAASSQAVFIAGAGPIAYRYDGGTFADLVPPASMAQVNGAWGASPDDVWMVGLGGATAHWTGGWGAACEKDDDCPGDDACLRPKCDGGECVLAPRAGAGCCGTPVFQASFDDGTLDGFVVADLYDGYAGMGGITWNVASHVDAATGVPRYSSPPNALYFGIPGKPCPGDPSKACPDFDNGKTVGSTATTPDLAIPEAESVTLTFQVFFEGETYEGYDDLEVRLTPAGGTTVTVWKKKDVVGGFGNAMVPVEVDLTKFAGRSVRLELRFDSKDPAVNNGEGAYVDDVVLTTTCGGTIEPPANPTLFAVSGLGPGQAFAVGAGGATLRTEAGVFRPFGVWGRRVFRGACADAAGVWAVGAGGTVVRAGADGAFREVQSPVTADLLACAPGMVAVGAKGAAVRGGASGVEVAGPAGSVDLEGVSLLPDGTGWAVGAGGGLVQVAADALTVFPAIANGVHLHAVWTGGPKSAVAVGDGGMAVRYNGMLWVASKTGADTALYAVDGAGDAVVAAGKGGAAVAWKDGAWAPLATQVTGDVRAVKMTSATEGWLAGAGGLMLHLQDGLFTNGDAPTRRDLHALAASPDGTLWAAGDGVVLRLDAGKWSVAFSTTEEDLRAVHALDATHVFAVGKAGAVYRHDGLNWRREPIPDMPAEGGGTVPFATPLYGVWAAKADEVWAVGEAGAWLRFDGKEWQAYGTGVDATLRAVHGRSATDAWMVGGGGTVLHVGPAGVEREETTPVGTLYGVFATKDAVFAVGDTGTVLRRE